MHPDVSSAAPRRRPARRSGQRNRWTLLAVAALGASCQLNGPLPLTSSSSPTSSTTGRSAGGGSSGSASTSNSGSTSGSSTGGTSSGGSTSSSGGTSSGGGSSGTPLETVGLSAVIAAGNHHTCAIVSTGVQCWGDDGYWQLGNNSGNQSPVPVAVQGLGGGVQALAAGADHTCALLNGGVQCWGRDDSGQLGNGLASIAFNYPVGPVLGLGKGVQALGAGYAFSCALVDGGVRCWGDNKYGQLGSPGVFGSPTPAPVEGLGSGVTALSVGEYHSCALANGAVWCWGDNSYGQLGTGSDAGSTAVPAAVQGLAPGVQALAAGGLHTCALVNGGALCWGDNANGQLGDDSMTDSPAPIPVHGLESGVQAIAASNNHSCAIVNGGLWCWGDDDSGDLGSDSDAGSRVPVPVDNLGSGAQALALGYFHSCALVAGAVQCWGDNGDRQLGSTSDAGASWLPLPVVGLVGGVQALAAGEYHTCALVRGGVQCWGDNTQGQLGNNFLSGSSVPFAIPSLGSGVQALAASNGHGCAIVNGGAECWGDNADGDLGSGLPTQTNNLPVAVQNLGSGVQALAEGWFHSCAVVNGAALCWGNNSEGQLGDSSDAGSDVPVPVQGLDGGVQALAAGGAHTCALVNGGVLCWGYNNAGQLGHGFQGESSAVPVAVTGLAGGVQAIVAGYSHTCALVSGGVQCWGDNAFGDLGNDLTPESAVPVPVVGLGSPGSGVQALAAGDYHTCALANGGVQCWGDNSAGQLGNGSDAGGLVPVQVVGLDGGVQALAAGGSHTCALVAGAVLCWGDNGAGELGDGTDAGGLVPVPVAAWAP